MRNIHHCNITFSKYKSTNTYEVLIEISPSGIIPFVSKLYAGSISYKELACCSGIFKGKVPTLRVRACGNKKGIASVRIHVEWAMECVKSFQVFTFIHVQYSKSSFVCVCSVKSFHPPLCI